MIKTLLDKENRYILIIAVLSILLIGANIFFDPVYAFLIFPIYSFFLFFYYYKRTKKFNWFLFFYLGLVMLSEIGFVYDFTTYFDVVLLISSMAHICMIVLLKPALKIKIKNFETHNLIELIVGFIGITTLLFYGIYIVFSLVSDVTFFVLSLISFFILCSILIGVPLFNKHPKSIVLWGIGSGLIAEMVCAFIYEFLMDARIFLVMAYIFSIFMKSTLIYFLTIIDEVVNTDD